VTQATSLKPSLAGRVAGASVVGAAGGRSAASGTRHRQNPLPGTAAALLLDFSPKAAAKSWAKRSTRAGGPTRRCGSRVVVGASFRQRPGWTVPAARTRSPPGRGHNDLGGDDALEERCCRRASRVRNRTSFNSTTIPRRVPCRCRSCIARQPGFFPCQGLERLRAMMVDSDGGPAVPGPTPRPRRARMVRARRRTSSVANGRTSTDRLPGLDLGRRGSTCRSITRSRRRPPAAPPSRPSWHARMYAPILPNAPGKAALTRAPAAGRAPSRTPASGTPRTTHRRFRAQGRPRPPIAATAAARRTPRRPPPPRPAPRAPRLMRCAPAAHGQRQAPGPRSIASVPADRATHGRAPAPLRRSGHRAVQAAGPTARRHPLIGAASTLDAPLVT